MYTHHTNVLFTEEEIKKLYSQWKLYLSIQSIIVLHYFGSPAITINKNNSFTRLLVSFTHTSTHVGNQIL